MTSSLQSTPFDFPDDTSIVIVAPNTSTRFGGEAVLPLHYFRILRDRGRLVTLLTHERNRADLSSAFGENCPDIFYVPDTKLQRIFWHIGEPLPRQIRVHIFGTIIRLLGERIQAKMIRKLVAAGRADLIHQPTPVSPKQPSSVYGFGIPVIIGPMNGGMTYPSGYEDFHSFVDRLFVPAARALAGPINWMIPGKRFAAALLVSNDRTKAALPILHKNVITLVENGVDLGTFDQSMRGTPSPAGTIRLIFMGRLIPLKAVDITIRALAEVRKQGIEATLDVLGDGECRKDLENLCVDLGLEEAVIFHGFITQKECAEYLRLSDALILNSLHECGGAVVLEAMSLGLPVIASDWGGPADYIDSTTGILVSPCPRETFSERLANSISLLARNPQTRIMMGRSGAEKVCRDFDWAHKVDTIEKVYASVLLGSKK